MPLLKHSRPVGVVWDIPRLAWEEQVSKQSIRLSNIPELTPESDQVRICTSRQDSRRANNQVPGASTFRKLPSHRPEDNFIPDFYSCLLIRIHPSRYSSLQSQDLGAGDRRLALSSRPAWVLKWDLVLSKNKLYISLKTISHIRDKTEGFQRKIRVSYQTRR